MRVDLLAPLALAFLLFRFAYVAAGLAGAWWLWRRPRASHALLLVLGLNLAAWAAYVAPLHRLYALEEHTDQSFNVGTAACAAAGNSPFDHMQAGMASLEPLWTASVAALSLYRPERVIPTYFWMPPLSLIVVAFGLYLGLRRSDAEEEAWERVLIVFAFLGLSSFSLSQRMPTPALWTANFLLKPEHAMGWGMVGVVLGMRARRAGGLATGLVLGLLAWVFILHWAFLAAGLVAGMMLRGREDRDWGRLALSLLVSTLIAIPYVLHLARDYSPVGKGGTPVQIWRDPMGLSLALPQWATLDLGPLFLLGIGGVVGLKRRGSPLDRDLLGLLAAIWGLWLAYAALAPFHVAPEPDEQHYFLRFAMSLSAGVALAALGRWLEASRGLRAGQGAAVVMALALPLTFPAYWDPPTMDRYLRWCLPPVRPKILAYGEWVRLHTPRDAIFVAGESASIWIPVLSGRRVLLAGDSRPPADYAARKRAERVLLASGRPDLIREAARQFDVSYVAVDSSTEQQYGAEALAKLADLGVYEPVYSNSAVRILRIREDHSRGGSDEK